MKEFLMPLTEPVGAVWAVMALGLVWLLIRRRWQGAIVLGVPTVLLFVLGSTSLVEGLVEKEEAQWEYQSLWNILQRPELKNQGPRTTGLSRAVTTASATLRRGGQDHGTAETAARTGRTGGGRRGRAGRGDEDVAL